MENSPLGNPTAESIEAALRIRPRADTKGHHDEILSLAKVITGRADEALTLRMNRHLAICEDCRETLMALSWADPCSDISCRAAMTTKTQNKKRWRIVSLAAAAITVALGIGFLSLTPEHSQEKHPLAIKGREDDLIVGVKRDGRTFVASPLQVLKTGDRVGFFYTASKSGYLAVVNRDGTGTASVMFPNGALSSARIDTGEEIPIPDGAVVERGKACEWIVAVFSDAPMQLEKIKSAVENARPTGERCELSLEMEHARTIVVFPFRR